MGSTAGKLVVVQGLPQQPSITSTRADTQGCGSAGMTGMHVISEHLLCLLKKYTEAHLKVLPIEKTSSWF